MTVLSLWEAEKAKLHTWYHNPLEGCVSSNGRPYSISLKRGNTNKLLVFFVGGGGSWNEETAARPLTVASTLMGEDAYYISDLSAFEMEFMHVGILNATDRRNPFHGWDMLTLPYSTADFHIGNNDYPYKDTKGRDKVLHHHGARNVQMALEVLREFHSETPEILAIAGLSAGAFGCVAHCAQIEKLYPECKNIVVYSEGSHLHSAQWPAIIRDIWKASPDLVEYSNSNDLIVDLFRYAHDKMPPHTKFLHSNSLWDKELTRFMYKMNHDSFLINEEALQEFNATLLSVVKTLRSEIDNYSYYITDYERSRIDGTTPHTFSGTPLLLYHTMQNGLSIADWLRQAFEREPFDVGEELIEETWQ